MKFRRARARHRTGDSHWPLVWAVLFFVVVFGTLVVLAIDAYQYRRACQARGYVCVPPSGPSFRCQCTNLERIEP